MQHFGVVYILWSNIYFHTYHPGSDRDIFIHRFIPVFWHDSLTLIGYRGKKMEAQGRGNEMEQYDTTREGAIFQGMPEDERAAWWWMASFFSWPVVFAKMTEWGY
jgi:hypothetical protein